MCPPTEIPQLSVLIAGCGMVGTALGRGLAEEGHRVWGVRRRPWAPPAGIRPIRADLTLPQRISSLPENLDFVVYLVSSDERTDEAYTRAYVEGLRNLLQTLDRRGRKPRRIFFGSSTAVYGQNGGEWVDEESPAEPVRFNGRRILEAESVLFGSPFPGTAIRFAGLYGPDRVRLLKRVLRGLEVRARGRSVYTNRIHVRDAARTIRHLMFLESPEPVYVAADCEPVERNLLIRWLADNLGASPPPFAEPGDEPGLRGNKRCRNRRLIESGYRFTYPTYREGYRAIIDALGPLPPGRLPGG